MAVTLATLERRIERIKADLQALGDLRPGYLSQQCITCGRAACPCHTDPGRRHGPRHQLGWARHGQSRRRYIRMADVATIQGQLQTHARLRELVQEWIDTAIALCELKLQASRKAAKAARKR
jgi:hypothetical protein